MELACVQYSFESWQHSPPHEPGNSGNSGPEAEAYGFSFSQDLRELEESLSMGLSESLKDYASLKGEPENTTISPPDLGPIWALLQQVVPEEGRWDNLARMVADHILVYLQEIQHPLQTELARVRGMAEEYYEDNRVLAGQVHELRDENQRLRDLLNVYELNLAKYRHLLGNLYMRL